MKDERTIDTLIAAEKVKLGKVEQKQAELAKKARACKSNIDKFVLMKNNRQFCNLSNMLNDKGLSIEQIFTAVSAGDLLSLQKKIETAVNSENLSSVSDDEREE